MFSRQRQLPFGSRLQNHALNNRLNGEFKNLFKTSAIVPLTIDDNRYWINENLLLFDIGLKKVNIATTVIEILDKYILHKQRSHNQFIEDCKALQKLSEGDITQKINFIKSLLKPNIDARIFEIVSFAILKAYYNKKSVFIGFARKDIQEQNLILYKTGRVNANDGGIDFVMKPLGRFFQVTETIDAGKYFLDIDKVQKYPITFVVKTNESCEAILEQVRVQAENRYLIQKVINKFIESIEETINIPILLDRLEEVIQNNAFENVMSDIITYSNIEFNIEEELEIEDGDDLEE